MKAFIFPVEHGISMLIFSFWGFCEIKLNFGLFLWRECSILGGKESVRSLLNLPYCPVDRDALLSSSYVNMIGPLAKNCHSFKFVQNRSEIFW